MSTIGERPGPPLGVVAGALATFYVIVLAASGGWAHLADRARTDWWLLAPMIVAFGTQVALTVELRVACCAPPRGRVRASATDVSTVVTRPSLEPLHRIVRALARASLVRAGGSISGLRGRRHR